MGTEVMDSEQLAALLRDRNPSPTRVRVVVEMLEAADERVSTSHYIRVQCCDGVDYSTPLSCCACVVALAALLSQSYIAT